MRIEYHPAVESDFCEIRDFYESRSSGLGADFVEAFEEHVLRIAAMPERWMIVRGDIRRALMQRFPYVVYFKIITGAIRITVVRHSARHPSFGMRRE